MGPILLDLSPSTINLNLIIVVHTEFQKFALLWSLANEHRAHSNPDHIIGMFHSMHDNMFKTAQLHVHISHQRVDCKTMSSVDQFS